MAATDVDTIVDTARDIERLGYDYLAVGEHLFFHVPTPNAMTALAAAAAVTQRVELLSAVVQLPLYPAPLLAKMSAVIDTISGGRFNLGVGVGGEEPREFEACGVDVSSRGRRSDEALEVMTRLWTEEAVSYRGDHTVLREVTLDPAPSRKPHPPIWVSGRKRAALRRAARFGQWWMPYMYTPEMFASGVNELAELANNAGRDAKCVRPGLFTFISCHGDREYAVNQAVRLLSDQYHQDFSHLVEKYVVTGTPDDCIGKLTQYTEAGAEAIILVPLGDATAVAEMRERLAIDVLPAFPREFP
ncbi:LLM class flavin-dependent oxidoreductase [Prauserella muralis]|nr:LLM class flavin-dependent oxidoreductase [Prauserella muralis]